MPHARVGMRVVIALVSRMPTQAWSMAPICDAWLVRCYRSESDVTATDTSASWTTIRNPTLKTVCHVG